MGRLPSSPTGAGASPPNAGRRPDESVAPPSPSAIARARAGFGRIRRGRRAGSLVAVIGVALLGIAWAGTGYRYEIYTDEPAVVTGNVPAGGVELKQLAARLDRRSREASARLKTTTPRGVYIVIDQTQNRLYLKRDDDTLLDARCSAGSGMVLKETGGQNREWVFDTPRGRFEVLGMARNPVWAKPDWAFVEDGQPIPTNPSDRFESGSLGEYALSFGNGYMIHGTLYERLLGRAVSHGCIRVGRDDLRKVWAHARLGTRIYIY
jgi:L,D-transpeptidase ErfK/SrfK